MFGLGILSGLLIIPLIGAAFILCLRGTDDEVRSNVRCAARSRSGSPWRTLAATTGPSGNGSEATSIESIEALPQTPQAEVTPKLRSTSSLANGRLRCTVTTL